MEENYEQGVQADQTLAVADGVRILGLTVDSLSRELANVQEGREHEHDSEFFRLGLLAALAVASAQRIATHAAYIFEDAWPGELVSQVFAKLEVTGRVTAGEYLPLVIDGLGLFRDTYQGLYERLSAEAGLPAFSLAELSIDDSDLDAWLSGDR